ncbi:hypothetical protein HPB49_010971 [Dermacentor silvarum]|uniref:Uncharacterized protein n=1 Tax=Dermacentor silvarum TaxID=543639 RepID=A0ACB8DCL9_DERSI|nr:hypothetical protein HPB49_010971 [Dermacentor silvarum]
MADAITVTGYDPTSLRVVMMETTSSDQAMPSEHEYLADMVKLWQRKHSQAAAPPKGQGSRAATLPQVAASGSSTHRSPDGTRTAPPSPPRRQPKWRPRHTPRLSRDDYIVVLKPRAPFELKSVLPSDRAGDTIRAYLGEHSSTSFHVWPVWDQNVLVCSVTSLPMAQHLLGDILLPVGDQQLPFRGHANASGEICRGVITINPAETPQRIKSELEWSQGAILAVRKLGDSTAAVVTFEGTKLPRLIFYPSVVAYVRPYKKTIMACFLCGTIGHRPSACPRPTPGRCTRCGIQVQVTSEGLAEHECNPTCLLCSGPHETGARGGPGKYRKRTPPSTSKPPAPPSPGTRAASQPVWITSPDPGEPTADHLSALPAACCDATSVVKPVDPQPSSRATPTPRTPPSPPASSTAPAAQPVTGAPQSPLSIDHTLPLEDRITRLENVLLYQISTINVQYIVPEVVQVVQAWALTQFRARSSRSRSASTSSSSAPRRRKVADSSSLALHPASIPLPAPQGQGRKHSHLLFFQSLGSLPSVLALQEAGPNPTVSGYCSYIGGTTTSLLVHKSYKAVQVDLDLDLPYDYCMISVLPQKRGAQSIHILNVYCPPHLQRVTFVELFYRALQAAARQPLVVARGRKLKELISTLTDPAHPTRLGNSVTRDTCPDLPLTRNIRHVTWENLEDTLDSDHFLLRIAFPTQKMRQIRGPARITDWSAFRTTPFPLLPSPQNYQAWASYALHTHQSYTRCISADYSAQLAYTNWVDTCMKAAGQMSSKSTWRLFRSLLDPSTIRGETQRQLRRAYYAYQDPTSQLANDLCDCYLCRSVDPKGPEFTYNPQLGCPKGDLRIHLTKIGAIVLPALAAVFVARECYSLAIRNFLAANKLLDTASQAPSVAA